MSRRILILMLLLPVSLFAQETLYLGPGTVFKADSNAVVGIIGNVQNHSGASGNVQIHRNSLFYFYGTTWNQAVQSPVSGQGSIRFVQPQPSPYSGNVTQQISGAGISSSLSNIRVENAQNVELKGTSLFVKDTLRFVAGHVVLNKKNLTLGNNNPGVIAGYDSLKYVVTNHDNSSDSGYLIRKNIGSTSGQVVFPVGRATGDYTPAALSNSGTADTFMVRVFQHVYEAGNSGILKDNESVGRTWQVRDAQPGGSNVSLTLQHNINTEGSLYTPNRLKHYISRYAGYSGSNGGDTVSGSNWDLKSYSNLGSGTSPATLTTGSSMSSAVMSTRTLLDTLGYFTKTTYAFAPLPIDLIDLKAVWKQRDAVVSWTTLSEQQVAGFDIERSEDGNVFTLAGKVVSLAPGGSSNIPLHYSFTDPDRKTGNGADHYYRLKIKELDGSWYYSPWVKLEDGVQVTMRAYPNPTVDWLQLEGSALLKGDGVITVWDMSGKLVSRFTAEPGSLLNQLDVRNFAGGVYHIEVAYPGQRWMFKVDVIR